MHLELSSLMNEANRIKDNLPPEHEIGIAGLLLASYIVVYLHDNSRQWCFLIIVVSRAVDWRCHSVGVDTEARVTTASNE